MLRSFTHLLRDRLGALDGEIGPVKDFYFDDRTWSVRYLIADTGSWLTERKVLIPPQAIGRLDMVAGILHVHLTRQAIEDSPSIDTHKPVSRQYEEEYHRYFGWPSYWQTSAYLGMDGFPTGTVILDPDAPPVTAPPAVAEGDGHLRSALAVNGYHLRATDGAVGHLSDFLIDDRTWQIEHLVVKTGSWFSGKELLVTTSAVRGVSYATSTITVGLTKGEIERGVEVDKLALQAAPVVLGTAAPLRSIPAVPAVAVEPSVSDVAQLAYQLYVKENRIHGHDLQHWLQSEAVLRTATRQHAQTTTKTAAASGAQR